LSTKLKSGSLYSFGWNIIAMSLLAGISSFIAAFLLASRIIAHFSPETKIGTQLSYLVLLSLNVATIAWSIPLAYRTRMIVREVDEALKGIVLLLDMVSVGKRTGMTIVDSLRNAARVIPSHILKEKIITGVAEVEYGEALENAVMEAAEGLPRTAAESLKILIPASYAGEKAGEILQLARDFMRRLMMFSEVRRTSLSLYLYIALISVGIFEAGGAFLLYLMSSISSSAYVSIPFITANYIQTWLFLYVTGFLLSVFSSMYVAKVVRGKTKLFSDYLLLFLILNLAIMGIVPIFI